MDGLPAIEEFATHSDFIALDLGERKKRAILYIAELHQIFQCINSHTCLVPFILVPT